MPSSQRARTRGRRAPSTALAPVVLAALVGLAGCRSTAESSPPAASLSGAQTSAPQESEGPARSDAATRGDVVQGEVPGAPPGGLQGSRLHRVGPEDGAVPAGTTVFDDAYPAVTKLDPYLLGALRTAAKAAEADGVTFSVTSGWRSDTYQQQLFEQAVSQYGSEAKAAQWVARPGTSVHEAGGAVDLGPVTADTWLSHHGAAYGLCQIYRNEPWHYELRPGAVDHGCPAMYADPTHDPRMQP